ncbi:MAG: hypothetical protein AB7L26_05275 [Hyphomonadaceae bacterium]
MPEIVAWTFERLAGRAWFAASNTLSVIGAISVVDDLQTWRVAIEAVAQWLGAHLQLLYVWLLAVGTAIHTVVEVYRDIVHPIVHWLLQWVPFEIPGVVIDLGIVVSLAVGGVTRARLAAQMPYASAKARFERLVRRELERDGIQLDRSDFERVISYITSSSYRIHMHRGQDPEIMRLLGGRIDKYADMFGYQAYEDVIGRPRRQLDRFEQLENRLVHFWAVVSFALASFVFLDWIAFSVVMSA